MLKHFAGFFIYLASIPAYSFTLSLGTDYPIGVHGELGISFAEENLYARLRYARFFSSYTNSINGLSEDFEFYNSATGDIIAAVLKDANFYEAGFGWQQNNLSGWSFDASYAFTSGEGQVTGSTISEAVIGVNLPAGSNLYDVSGELQLIGFSGGYKWALNELSTLNLRFGVLKPIDSETKLDRDTAGPVQEALLAAANKNLDAYLKDVLKNDVYIPIIGISWMYLF